MNIATLGLSLRLIVFKFLIKSDLVPPVIPRVPISQNTPTEETRGRQVLVSTPDIWIPRLVLSLFDKRSYKFVGARVAGERVSERMKHGSLVEVIMSDVRFTFCHRQYLNDKPPHENFTRAIKDRCRQTLTNMAINNLWSVEGYLNPHLQEDGSVGIGDVLMLDCNGRKQAIQDGKPVKVYAGSLEKNTSWNQAGCGIGPKISLIDKASRLDLVNREVVLVNPAAAISVDFTSVSTSA